MGAEHQVATTHYHCCRIAFQSGNSVVFFCMCSLQYSCEPNNTAALLRNLKSLYAAYPGPVNSTSVFEAMDTPALHAVMSPLFTTAAQVFVFTP